MDSENRGNRSALPPRRRPNVADVRIQRYLSVYRQLRDFYLDTNDYYLIPMQRLSRLFNAITPVYQYMANNEIPETIPDEIVREINYFLALVNNRLVDIRDYLLRNPPRR